MKIPWIFCLVLFFLAGDIAVPGFRETSSAGAEEVVQLARLNHGRSFRRRVSGGSRFRSKVRTNKNRRFVRKVFSSPRRSRTRQGRVLARRRLVPRQVVAPTHKRLVARRGGALADSHAVVNSISARQSKIRGQFSTAARRRFD